MDTFSCYLAGPAWRERQIPDSLAQPWARSPNRWWRRAAVVSTVALNSRTRGGSGDTARTVMICRLVFADCGDTVVKGFSASMARPWRRAFGAKPQTGSGLA